MSLAQDFLGEVGAHCLSRFHSGRSLVHCTFVQIVVLGILYTGSGFRLLHCTQVVVFACYIVHRLWFLLVHCTQVVALDFDGVVCDSVGESSLSAIKVRVRCC